MSPYSLVTSMLKYETKESKHSEGLKVNVIMGHNVRIRLLEHAGLGTCIVREVRRQDTLFRPSNSNGERSKTTEP